MPQGASPAKHGSRFQDPAHDANRTHVFPSLGPENLGRAELTTRYRGTDSRPLGGTLQDRSCNLPERLARHATDKRFGAGALCLAGRAIDELPWEIETGKNSIICQHRTC